MSEKIEKAVDLSKMSDSELEELVGKGRSELTDKEEVIEDDTASKEEQVEEKVEENKAKSEDEFVFDEKEYEGKDPAVIIEALKKKAKSEFHAQKLYQKHTKEVHEARKIAEENKRLNDELAALKQSKEKAKEEGDEASYEQAVLKEAKVKETIVNNSQSLVSKEIKDYVYSIVPEFEDLKEEIIEQLKSNRPDINAEGLSVIKNSLDNGNWANQNGKDSPAIDLIVALAKQAKLARDYKNAIAENNSIKKGAKEVASRIKEVSEQPPIPRSSSAKPKEVPIKARTDAELEAIIAEEANRLRK